MFNYFTMLLIEYMWQPRFIVMKNVMWCHVRMCLEFNISKDSNHSNCLCPALNQLVKSKTYLRNNDLRVNVASLNKQCFLHEKSSHETSLDLDSCFDHNRV